MQTLTVQITGNNALKALHALEEKRLIKIVDDNEFESPFLPGEELSIKAFRNWISKTEADPTFDINEAQQKWQQKRKQLQKLIK